MSSSAVRVRFAPSPTGYLHIGGARTALFNWLLARQCGGQFILRIEDTDQTREVADSLPKILQDLRWLGLNWDEGPEIGGPYGPYFQSERLEIYRSCAERLLDQGWAYFTFDTPEELAVMRDQARSEKRTFRYPRPAQFPTRADAEQARAAGRPVVVRFRMPDHAITVHDSILGDVVVQAEDLEDFVIVKSDGFPTYHFACVIDDELMKISHILRAQEHLNNTPKHVGLQEALQFSTPVYAHLPLIFNINGTKMSKRDKEKALAKGEKPPEIDVHDFRMAGYLPEVILNFVALLGWSPGQDREKLSLDDMVQLFSLERIGKTNARFDRDKLLAFNTTGLATVSSTRRLDAFRDFLAVNQHPMQQAGDAQLQAILRACEGLRTFSDVLTKAGFIYLPDEAITYDSKAIEKVLRRNDGAGFAILRKLDAALQQHADWETASLDQLLKSLAEQWSIKFGDLAQPIRVAVSGTTVSPSISETLELLGHERTGRRIQQALRLQTGT
ncbi:MAG: Glutamate--tRNA ligase [Phycisphaerae bacterium]|nr:Glutamate--tRNA ligase [Phycisphaerae bacterium]